MPVRPRGRESLDFREAVAPAAGEARAPRTVATWALAAVLLGTLLLVLHGRYLRWPFVSDDLVFADASREPGQLFSTFHQYSNYFRPIGRELYLDRKSTRLNSSHVEISY